VTLVWRSSRRGDTNPAVSLRCVLCTAVGRSPARRIVKQGPQDRSLAAEHRDHHAPLFRGWAESMALRGGGALEGACGELPLDESYTFCARDPEELPAATYCTVSSKVT
jgi:hypothetical protein